MEPDHTSRVARRLWSAIEPIAANVYFAPEVHAAFEELGFDGTRGGADGIQFPDRVAYFTSRGACLGHVPGHVVAAAFGVFKIDLVVDAVAEGWAKTDRDTILDARRRGATASLSRILGREPEGLPRATAILQRMAAAAPHEGRHLFAGLSSLGFPGDPMGDFWRAADLVREHRGDSHVAAWVSAGLDAVEIGLITDPWRGTPIKSWVRTRGWSDEELEAGCERLRSRGGLDGETLTDDGRRLRDEIERVTDVGETRLIDALGDDEEELFSLLEPWRDAVVEAKGYPGAGARQAAAAATAATR